MMTEYTVTGVVPTPMYVPRNPVYGHHYSTMPKGDPYPVGEAGHTISVTSTSKTVAAQLADVLGRVLEDVTVEEAPDES